jgi:formylglycine-generating enzyme required for sulfatase activity
MPASSPVAFAVLTLASGGLLTGCPAFLSDGFEIAADGGTAGPDGIASAFDSSGSGPDATTPTDAAMASDDSQADGGNDGPTPESDSGGDSSTTGTRIDAGGGPSCHGLVTSCGAAGKTSCCSSSLVPGGTFNRSNDATYSATVSDFQLDNYEISVGRFRNFVAAYSQTMTASGAGKNPNDASDPGWNSALNGSLPADPTALMAALKCDPAYETWTDTAGADENLPINCIDWSEAFAFCIWDGGRLPTEAEWNYAAAGGGEQRQYPWGATVPGTNAKLAVYGCYYTGTGTCSGLTDIAPVGSIAAGNAKWGQSDLAGNVWEWTADAFASPYAATSCINCSYEMSGATNRVLRGGSFSFDATHLLTSDRSSYFGPNNNYPNVGARCARTP